VALPEPHPPTRQPNHHLLTKPPQQALAAPANAASRTPASASRSGSSHVRRRTRRGR
jgi:hypothetical protein